MLVGPDAGKNAGPTGAAQGVGAGLAIADDVVAFAKGAFVDEGVQMRGGRFEESVRAKAVDADEEELLDERLVGLGAGECATPTE